MAPLCCQSSAALCAIIKSFISSGGADNRDSACALPFVKEVVAFYVGIQDLSLKMELLMSI